MSESDEDEFEDEETEELSLKDIANLIQKNFSVLYLKSKQEAPTNRMINEAAEITNQMIEAAIEIHYDQTLTETVQFAPED